MRICAPAIASLLLVGLFAPSHASAQGAKRWIVGELRLPGGEEVKFGVTEGDIVTVRNDLDGYKIGLLVNASPDGKAARFDAFDISSATATNSGNILKLGRVVVESEPAILGELTLPSGSVQLSVRRIDSCGTTGTKMQVQPQSGVTQGSAMWDGGFTDSGVCCVTCDGITVCGGSVTMSCGSCSGSGGRLAV